MKGKKKYINTKQAVDSESENDGIMKGNTQANQITIAGIERQEFTLKFAVFSG